MNRQCIGIVNRQCVLNSLSESSISESMQKKQKMSEQMKIPRIIQYIMSMIFIKIFNFKTMFLNNNFVFYIGKKAAHHRIFPGKKLGCI